MVEELQSGFTVPSDDDFDGVDVTYINGVTGRRRLLNAGHPIIPRRRKSRATNSMGCSIRITLTRSACVAWIIFSSVTYQTTTELDALCYNTGDRIVLTDDIPGNNTISCLVEAMTTADGVTAFTVTGASWTGLSKTPCADPLSGWLCIRSDGMSRVGIIGVRSPSGDFDDPLKIDQTSPAIEPVRTVFCGSTRHVYDAIVEEIAHNRTGRVRLPPKSTARRYYDYDNASYPATLRQNRNNSQQPAWLGFLL